MGTLLMVGAVLVIMVASALAGVLFGEAKSTQAFTRGLHDGYNRGYNDGVAASGLGGYDAYQPQRVSGADAGGSRVYCEITGVAGRP